MISAAQDERIYEFGDFRLIPVENLLLHNGKKVALNPKAFAVLTLLVERHGHLVQKSEIIDKVWGDAFVEEGAISKSIWFVRSVLGDTSKEKFVQTIPRRGYRFVATVTVLNDPSIAAQSTDTISTGYRLPAPAEEDAPDSKFISAKEQASNGSGRGSDLGARTRGRSGILRLAGLVLFLAAGAAAAYMFYPWKTPAGVGGTRSIAVLPPRPIDKANHDELSDIGLADEIINRLAVVQGFKVRPLSSVRDYGPEKDSLEAGREQSVDYVLESSYQIADGKIKINSRLINVATGETESTYPFKTDAHGIFAVQDVVAVDLVNKLMARFGASLSGSAKKRGTENEEAYLSYIQGWLLLDRGNAKLKDGRPGALEYFDRAVTFDPSYARAWAAKSLAHNYAAIGGAGFEQYHYAVEAINKALSIDPGQSDAYAALCHEKLFYEWDYTGAEDACRTAIDLDPSSGPARMEYSLLLGSRGRWDENSVQLESAMELNPASYRLQWYYGNSLYFSRRYDEAVAQYKKVIDLVPDRDTTYEDLIKALEQQGNTAEAFEWYIKLLAQRQDEKVMKRFQTVYQESGYVGVLREKFETMKPSVTLCAQLGEKDKAFEILEDRYARHTWGMAVTFPIEPQLDPLRDDPRYADLIRRIESYKQ